MSLSIIIPCRNEEESIEITINEIMRHLNNSLEKLVCNSNQIESIYNLDNLKYLRRYLHLLKYFLK